MGCGGSKTQTTVQKQELDPRMEAYLYGSGGQPGLYDMAAQQFLGKKGTDLVADFNPLQKFAMQNMAGGLLSGQFNQGMNASNAAAQKLLKQAGVDWKPQTFQMPQFDVSQMFAPYQPQQAPQTVAQMPMSQPGPIGLTDADVLRIVSGAGYMRQPDTQTRQYGGK
jgi:hypothetical protein